MRSALLLTGLLTCCPWAWADETPTRPPTALEEPTYSFGYRFGGQLAELERRGTTVELSAILRGMLDALAGNDPEYDPDAMRAALNALDRVIATGGTGANNGPPARQRGFADDYARLNTRRAGVVTLASGVQYEVLIAGDGRHPPPDGTVELSYEGTLSNGVVFDTTYDDGETIRLRINQIAVPGLREALLRMREGDRWRIVIPPSMGFARSGNNQLRRRDLIYEVDLVSVADADQAPSDAALPTRN